MNPWGLLLILLGLAMVVIGFTGKQDDIVAAFTGKAYKGSNLT
jgi:hypothetical protein